MKIAINGTGIAGPTLAYWLRAYGHEPVLFEKAEQLREGGYVIDFWGSGYDVAERMGLAASIHAAGYQVDQLRSVDAAGHSRAAMGFDALLEGADGRFTSLARGDLAAIVYRACAGVESHFGLHVVGAREEADGVEVTLSDGQRRSFDLLIGADGLHSPVRALCFEAGARWEHPLGCHVIAFRLNGYPHRDEGVYVMHTDVKRQVARATLRDNQTLILMVFRSDLLDGQAEGLSPQALAREAFSDMGWEVAEILARMADAPQAYADRVSQVRLPRWSRGRIGLLGDAAACISLLGGEGSGLAMLEAYVLAGELHRAGGDHAQAFARYERKLRPFLAQKQRSAARMVGFFAPGSRGTILLRDLGLRMLSLPWIRRHTMARMLDDRFPLPAYA